jgi:type 1 glutamine amidotransferase/HEAT repeat protein
MAFVIQRVIVQGKLMRHSARCYFSSAILISVILLQASLAQLSPDEIKGIEQAAPSKSTVQPKQKRLLLVFSLSEGYKHSAIERVREALQIMGQKTGAYETVQSTDLSMFKPENLSKFDAVCFNNTTQLKFDDPAIRKSLLDFVASGKGLIGIHAATDNFPTWPEGQELWGGVFDNHPWTAEGTWAVKIEDPTHPINAAFGGKDFLIKDEIYRIKQINLRKNARVLLGLDMKAERNRIASGVRRTDRDLPISWVRAYGKGRVFYCSLGHNNEIYANPVILRHYLDGVQFALGDYPVDTTPIPFDPMSFFNQDSLNVLLRGIATYDYGDSRALMADVNEFIRNVDDLPEARRRLEQQFLAFLAGNATLAGKQFICSRLAILGSEASVSRLIVMLSDPTTADMALSTLQSIGGDKVDEALLQALLGSAGKTQIGIINALGSHRAQSSVSVLKIHSASSDSTVATAAFAALGNIGTPAALQVLVSVKGNVKPELRKNLLDAILAGAAQLEKEGNRDQAITVYQELDVKGEPIPIRSAAMRRKILLDPEYAPVMISKVLKSKEAELHKAVVQLVREVKGIDNIRAIARILPELPPSGQVQLLAAISGYRDAEIQKIVIESTTSERSEVRVAALRALATVGDASVVQLLASGAAAFKGVEQKEARSSLYDLNAPGAVDAIVAALPKSDDKMKVELIRALSEREEYPASSLVLYFAKDRNQAVRIECIKALRILAKSDQLSEIVGLLTKAKVDQERRELETTIIAVARRVPDSSKQDEAVLAAYPAVKTSATRVSFINVLGKIGAPASLPVLRAALTDKSADIRLAAIRALSEWPSAAPYPDLWKIASTTKDRTQKTLALRGSVRLIGSDTSHSTAEILKMYQDAMKLAPSRDELKLLLSSVGGARSLAAFRLATDYLKERVLAQEAEAAIVNIGEGIAATAGSEIIPDLKLVAQSSKNETIVRRAKRIIQNFERLEDHITGWEIAGPYTKEGVSLFDEPFAPEGPDAGSVQWKAFRSMTDPNRLWRLEFDKVIGGDFRVVYIRTNVWAPDELKARMEVGSDDGNKVWLNNVLVHAKDANRSVTPGEDAFPVTLRQGWNSLMMKINQGGGEWGACARFRALDGSRLEGIRISLSPN